MKVSFFEGSELICERIEDTIVDKMRGLARMQDELTCLFLADSTFSLAGEWAARRLQMIYPQKKIGCGRSSTQTRRTSAITDCQPHFE